MSTLRLNPGGIQKIIHDELSYHPQFEGASLQYDDRLSFQNKLAFFVPNYAWTLDSATINDICSRLGPLYTMEADAQSQKLWIYAHAPSDSALRALRLRKDRVVFVLTSTVWSVQLCAFMTLVALAMMMHAAYMLSEHWEGYDSPWETLLWRASHPFTKGD